MGLVLNVDLETSQGPTNELFVRIDSYKVNSTVGEIRFSTSAWLTKKYADAFLRKYDTDKLKPAEGIVAHKVIYYDDVEISGKEILIENYYSVPMYRKTTVKVDIVEEQEVTREVPFISFDEEGNEVTLYKSVTNTELVKTGTEKQVRNVYDYDIPKNNLGEFCYNYLIEELGKRFPIDKINKVN